MNKQNNKNRIRVTSMAHEIRQPLSAITILAGLSIDDLNEFAIDGDGNDKKLLYNLKEIVNQAHRCSQIMEKMSRDENNHQADFKNLYLNPIISEVLHELDYNDKAQKVTIRHNLEDDLPAIRGDGEAIRRLLFNLVNNAIYAMRKTSKKILTVRSYATKNGIQLEVMDTGCGIEKDIYKRIFESLYTTKGRNGMGLGLSICKTIVETHNGTISLDSKVNRGTCFKVFLPAKASEKIN